MIKKPENLSRSRPNESYRSCGLINIKTVEHQKGPLTRDAMRVHFARLLKKTFGKEFTLRLKNMVYQLSRLLHKGSSVSFNRGKKVATKDMPIFRPGDLVHVRSLEEIEATFDYGRSYKGCGFMSEMEKYCNTIQRVLKPVERFMDEREFRMKTARGIVLLDGLVCQGTARLGRCDRNCFYFWRVEWLEKIEPDKDQDKDIKQS